MFRNYVRVAFRNLLKSKGYTFINIVGLSIGIASCLFILLYVMNELSYDSFHPQSDRIYRVVQTSISLSKEEKGASTPFKVGPSMELEYPQFIDKTVRFFDLQEPSHTFQYEEGEKSFREENFYFVDSTAFSVFGFELVKGNPETVLDQPLSLVLTSETARRYFGEDDPVGKTLNYKGVADLTVTGVMEPLPGNSHMKIDLLASFSSLDNVYRGQDYDESWFWNPCWTYILLEEGATAQQVRDRLPAFAEKYYNPHRPEGEHVELELQSITDIHLHSQLDQEMKPNSSIFYVNLFSITAVLILVIACINFMNLSTAQAAERSREVGMRKVLGADRHQLIRQFLGESFLMSLFAIILAVLLVLWLLPAFNNFIGRKLVFNPIENLYLLGGITILFLVTGFMAGLYPAFYLSGFRPSHILMGSLSKSRKGAILRKSLVVFQFGLSVILIVSTVVVYLQIQHFQNKEMGFDREQVVVMPIGQTLTAWNFKQFKQEALRNPNILNVAGTQYTLGSGRQLYYKYAPADVDVDGDGSHQVLHVTHDFLDTYNIDLVTGRGFSSEFSTDPAQAILLNNKMVDHLQLDSPREAIGITFNYQVSEDEQNSYNVIGVVENFDHSSIKKEIAPLILRLVDGEVPIVRNIEVAAVNIAPGGTEEAIQHLEKVWGDVNHIDPFEYEFHEEILSNMYASEARMGEVAGIFTILCIFVASLGLFGLSSFTTSMRTREIGIRKTLGASINGIVVLLSKEYIKLIILANIITWPLVFLMAREWLTNFPYHINLGWNMFFIFVATAVFTILICLATVSYQSISAALMNPVDSIREE